MSLGGIEAGPVYALGKEEESAGALNVWAGPGVGDKNVSMGVGGQLRTKLGPKMGQLAVAPYFFGLFGGEQANVFFRLGFAFLQFESVKSSFAFGMFSPQVALGVMVYTGRDWGLTFAFDTEYAVRFTDTPNAGYVGLTIGVGQARFSPAPRFSRADGPVRQ